MNARVRTYRLKFRLNAWMDEMRTNEAKMRRHVAKQGSPAPDPWEFGLPVQDGFVAVVSGQPGPEPFVIPLGEL